MTAPAAAFAAHAEAFAAWLLTGTDTGPAAARAALGHVAGLYAAALALPPAAPHWAGGTPEVDLAEWRAAAQAAGRVPVDYYGVVDPLPVPPTEPTIGSLSDDLADIYRDIMSGLQAYQAGDEPGAARQWVQSFRCHWGRHAAEAVAALHAWVVEYDPVGSG